MAIAKRSSPPPLAAFVLRVTGQPAVLRYELHDVRTGERHRFTRADALTAFLRQQGLEVEHLTVDVAASGSDDTLR